MARRLRPSAAAAGCTFAEVGSRVDVGASKAKRMYRMHVRCIERLSGYSSTAAEVVTRYLRLIEDA